MMNMDTIPPLNLTLLELLNIIFDVLMSIHHILVKQKRGFSIGVLTVILIIVILIRVDLIVNYLQYKKHQQQLPIHL